MPNLSQFKKVKAKRTKKDVNFVFKRLLTATSQARYIVVARFRQTQLPSVLVFLKDFFFFLLFFAFYREVSGYLLCFSTNPTLGFMCECVFFFPPLCSTSENFIFAERIHADEHTHTYTHAH